MPLSLGDSAPDFTLPDQDGRIHTLSEYRGKPLVLYFYPKDDTSGCTKEACGFRDDYSAYQAAGVTILGVSPDSSKSHTNFITKYELPFTLLADPEREVLRMYGAWGLKKMYGREYEGVLRTTYLIGADGKIVKIYKKVKPAAHSAEILAALEELEP
ncbi:MAG TPA: thioredoxin-dependent thiol peroxidase [Anaerolineales bacterium]|nr:thioredoxin-dependent thiol peroxidase [Anaerolineales bacterium]